MINSDARLKQMFDATREVDRDLAPSFENFDLTHETAHILESSVDGRPSGSIAVTVADVAIAAVTGLFSLAQLNGPATVREAQVHNDLQELNELCESLLVAIHEPAGEMNWPTETDSLLPVETVNFRIE